MAHKRGSRVSKKISFLTGNMLANLKDSACKIKTSQELGNCPMGQREALLRERINLKKGFIEEEKNWSKFGHLVKIWKFGQNLEILLKL